MKGVGITYANLTFAVRSLRTNKTEMFDDLSQFSFGILALLDQAYFIEITDDLDENNEERFDILNTEMLSYAL